MCCRGGVGRSATLPAGTSTGHQSSEFVPRLGKVFQSQRAKVKTPSAAHQVNIDNQ